MTAGDTCQERYSSGIGLQESRGRWQGTRPQFRNGWSKPLPRTVRKFIGAVVLVVFVPFYALVAMTIAAARLPGASVWAQTLYFTIAGLIWVIPAGLLIKWMQRPDDSGRPD